MNNKIALQPSLRYAQDLADICRPLQRLQIDYFAQAFIDNSGKFAVLNNNAAFLEHYLRLKYFNADIHMSTDGKFNPYIVWDDVKLLGQSAKMHTEAGSFGVKHTFTIIEKVDQGINYFHFATNRNDIPIHQTYLANLELLKSFITYFKEKIKESKHLSDAYQMKITPEKAKKNASKFIFPDMQYKADFLNDISLTKHSELKEDIFKTRISALNISRREKDCLYLLIKGKSAFDIATELNLSRRTVETHLINIKEKINVRTKSELIGKVFSFCLNDLR